VPLPLAAFLAASSWAAKNVLLSGETLQLILTAVQVLRAPSLWEGVQQILSESEYGELTDLLDFAIDELLKPASDTMPVGTVIMWGGELIDDLPLCHILRYIVHCLARRLYEFNTGEYPRIRYTYDFHP